MIGTAAVMAIFISVGFGILFSKLPRWIKNFLSRRYILLDIVLCWAVFSALGFAMVGMMTAAMVSVIVSGWLYFKYNKNRNKKRHDITTSRDRGA